jgi:hypothetical protein
MNVEVTQEKNNENRVFSASDLRAMLNSPTDDILSQSNDSAKILIEGRTFRSEYITLNETVTVNYPLEFKGCRFESENVMLIHGLICNEDITFEDCAFPSSIMFSNGTFKKDLSLSYVRTSKVHFGYCDFNAVYVSGYDLDEVWMSGSRFENLIIGHNLFGENIKKITLFAKANETGDITVRQQSLDALYISGTNRDRALVFDEIRVNNVSLINFTNEGICNFVDIKPKNIDIDSRYFQVVNSTLDSTQFHQVQFSAYKEFIILHSFITESIFISCGWSSNIRAIHGPSYPSFKQSITEGRKITSAEIVNIKEAYRQLKISMSKHSDRIQEMKFYSQELNYHNRSLKWTWPWNDQFWDKVILSFSKAFGNYGQSFVRPLFWLFVVYYVLFLIALVCGGFYPLQIDIWTPTASGFEEAFEKFFIYINPLRKLDTSFSGYLILIDLLMRIWSSYMIYNIIKSSRRFIS